MLSTLLLFLHRRYMMRVASSESTGQLYFVATSNFLGHKRSAYARNIHFALSTLNISGAPADDVITDSPGDDVIIRGFHVDFSLVATLPHSPSRDITNYTVWCSLINEPDWWYEMIVMSNDKRWTACRLRHILLHFRQSYSLVILSLYEIFTKWSLVVPLVILFLSELLTLFIDVACATGVYFIKLPYLLANLFLITNTTTSVHRFIFFVRYSFVEDC